MSALDVPTELERRLAVLIMEGNEFSANELTMCGTLTIDTGHAPNAAQNGIGPILNEAARKARITFTGRITQSCSPTRKTGMIRIWAPTEGGRLWAANVLR